MGKKNQIAATEETIREYVNKCAIEMFGVSDGTKLTDETRFIDDLGADSLDTIEYLMRIEDVFGVAVSSEDEDKLASIGDVVNYIMAKNAEGRITINPYAMLG